MPDFRLNEFCEMGVVMQLFDWFKVISYTFVQDLRLLNLSLLAIMHFHRLTQYQNFIRLNQ